MTAGKAQAQMFQIKKIMKNNLLVVLLGVMAVMVGTSTGHSSIIKLKSGSLDFLKGEAQVNVEYSYEGMRVGKFEHEQDYIDKEVAEFNNKEAGKGELWRQNWIADRARRYQPKFEDLLNSYLAKEKSRLMFGSFKDAKYTLVLKTTFTEPGWVGLGLIRQSSLISADAVFLETQNRATPLAAITITKSPGFGAMGYDYDPAIRIQESYAKAGKEFGIFIGKKIK
jgi:hypothetical protein